MTLLRRFWVWFTTPDCYGCHQRECVCTEAELERDLVWRSIR